MIYGRDLFKLLIKSRRILFLILITFTLSSFAITQFLIPKRFVSTVDLISKVSQQENAVSDATFNLTMIKTYKEFIKTDTVLADTANKMKDKYQVELSVNQLQQMIDITQANDSQIFTIEVTSDDALLSKNLANVVGEVLVNKISEVLQLNSQVVIITGANKGKEEFPKMQLNVAVGFVLGILVDALYILLVLVRESNRISSKYLVDKKELVFLGSVSARSKPKAVSLKKERALFWTVNDPQTGSQYRARKRLRTNRYQERGDKS